jgi:hypothetical protein
MKISTLSPTICEYVIDPKWWGRGGGAMLSNKGEVIVGEGDEWEGLDEWREVEEEWGDNIECFPNFCFVVSVCSKTSMHKEGNILAITLHK